jgi:transposase
MARKKRRKFTPEQRAHAVRILRESGKSAREVGADLDVPTGSLSRWAKQADVDTRLDPNGPLTTEERSELVRLRRENRVLQQERSFLKKAASFFARENP